jgi:predicted O-methyltransferase YrrM
VTAEPPVWIDQSFGDLLRRHPALDAMRRYLESPTGFPGQREIQTLQSSYSARGYGSLLYALARVLRPLTAVEIGIFQGFSLLSVGAALRDNTGGHITAYDLFDAYPYRHADRGQVLRHVAALGLQSWVTIEAGDAYEVHRCLDAVDYLHVDVSNTGDTYRRVFEHWSAKVRQVIVLEGGSIERDNVAWMREYGKPPIVPAVNELQQAHPEWSFTVLLPFPSMTIACNRTAIAGFIR